jgi:hypothetical protein
MNALIQKQYAQVKKLVKRIELERKYYISLNAETEHKNSSLLDRVKLMDLFALLTGNADLAGSAIIGSHNVYEKIEQIFEEYEKSLLEADLIEFGDTLTDEQKLHYYNQQQQLQEAYYRNEF